MARSHLSKKLVHEAKFFIRSNPDYDPFESRSAFVDALAKHWSHASESYYDVHKTAALRKKARRYLRAALSELYPTRMFLRKAKHNLRFSVLKLKNSF